jgi:hypothetical protein
MIKLDADGYPEFLDVAVPFWLTREAAQAVDLCPALAPLAPAMKIRMARQPSCRAACPSARPARDSGSPFDPVPGSNARTRVTGICPTRPGG